MKIPTLYLDTSVLGGYFDDEFAEPTRELWRQRALGLFHFVTSSVVRAELQDAPDDVKSLVQDTFREAGELIEFNAEMFDLSRAYLAHAVVAPSYEVDARHVAVCSVRQLDFLVSWNFKHLVNVSREKGFSAVNLVQGYQPVRIVSPLELIYGLTNEEV